MSNDFRLEIYNEFKKAGELMTAYGYDVGNGKSARLFLEYGMNLYATKEKANLKKLEEGDIEVLPKMCLPIKDTEFKAMIFFETPYLMKALKLGRAFGASLDDMAQIIGQRFEVLDTRLFMNPLDHPNFIDVTKKVNASAIIRGYNEETNELEGFYMTIGRDLKEAVIGMEVLEKNAMVTFLGDKVSFAKIVNPFDVFVEHKVYTKKYSKHRLDGFEHPVLGEISKEEIKARKDLVDYGKKLVKEGLVYGTWGNLSIRLDDQYMLLTPSGLDYMDLKPEDMVKTRIDNLEYEGLKPTSEKVLHKMIYENRPDVKAIVHTHSTYCSVFSACEVNLPIMHKEDEEIYGDGFYLATYGLSGTKNLAKATVTALGDRKGALMSHHGMVACGSTIKEAFDTACFMENNAKELIDSIPDKNYSLDENTDIEKGKDNGK